MRPDFSPADKAFHWVTVLLVAGMLGLGLTMGGVDDLTLKLRLYNLHKSTGACVLALTLCRLLWRAAAGRPGFVPGLKAWEKRTARAVHALLYALLLAMPLSGWAMSAAAGRPVAVFGLFTLPDLAAADEDLAGIFREIHEILAFSLIAAICLHAGAALKHHFIDRDDTLRRMLPFAHARGRDIMEP